MLFSSVILSIFVVTIEACAGGHCRRQQFFKSTNTIYTGAFLARNGPWPYTWCERQCRQYLECYNFMMEWVDDEKKYGYCGIIGDEMEPDKLTENMITTKTLYRKL